MRNQLQIFKNKELGEVRTLIKNEEIWFVAKDISNILDYSETSKMLRRLDDDEDIRKITSDKLNNVSNMAREFILINEKGLHKILSSTRKVEIKTKNDIFKWLANKEYDEYISQSYKESEFISKLRQVLEPFNIRGVRQYKVLNYKVDYYIPKLNIAIEYDENNHDNYTYEQQEGRQKEIEEELGCKFVRVSDGKSHLWNIGFIMKELMKGMVA